jgi:AmpD protein
MPKAVDATGAFPWRQGWWLGARRIASPNFGPRPKGEQVSLVVLHHISLPPGEFGGTHVEAFFTNRLDTTAHPYFAALAQTQVSAHFFIPRDGAITQFVSADMRAWHAGASVWQGRENCNDYSIGIELEGDERPYEAPQYAALWKVLQAIVSAYSVTAVCGHEHIAPGRKTDPGPGFDWQALARHFPALRLPDGVMPNGC